MTAEVRLTDIERRLALFANGITGRHHEIRAYGDDAGANAINLPPSFDGFAREADNLGAYRCMTLHQLAYQEFGTYSFRIDAARARCRSLAVRKAPSASARQSDYDQFYAHFDTPTIAQRIFEVLEGHRVDVAMVARYPGIAPHYLRLRRRELELRDTPANELLDRIIDGMVRWTLGESPTGSLLIDITAIAQPIRDPDADVYTSARATAEIIEGLEQLGILTSESMSYEVLDAPATERPSFQGPPPNEWLQREDRLSDWYDLIADLDEAMESEADDPEGGHSVVGRQLSDQRDTLARRADMERSALANALDPEDARGRRSTWYPEWDAIGERYLPRWCRVYEETLEAEPAADPTTLLRRIDAHRAKVRDCFAQLPHEALQRVRHVIDGDDLNWDDLIRYAVDRHRGETPDDRVYERRERAARDIATAFLVDLSASTDDPIVKPTIAPTPIDASPTHPNLRDPFDDDPYLWGATGTATADDPPRRIIDVLRESLWLMAAGLNDWGDAFAIYGFSGYSRQCVEFATVKGFREPWDGRAARALVAMKPRRSTRMGPAIRHTQRQLMGTGAALKIMVLLSDGFPQDCDYGPDRGNHDYGVADTGKALAEAEAAGIRTFCVTVDPSGHDYLQTMCPDDRYLVIEDIDELPEALAQVYRRLTA